jgi:hypothetical protein
MVMLQTTDTCENRDYPQVQEETRRAVHYAYARTRARLPNRGRQHVERGYGVAKHFAQVIAARCRNDTLAPEQLFHEHVERWKNETGHLSSITKMITHPSYLRIIGLGREGLPLILRELRERPDHWLVALNAITGEDPAPEGARFSEAVAAWIKWGEAKGYC